MGGETNLKLEVQQQFLTTEEPDKTSELQECIPQKCPCHNYPGPSTHLGALQTFHSSHEISQAEESADQDGEQDGLTIRIIQVDTAVAVNLQQEFSGFSIVATTGENTETLPDPAFNLQPVTLESLMDYEGDLIV
mmetsp:Transcript_10606/g.20865  ORF Transcript_10606/g.20865 Transcript_10606/m.20865 type:complete len:135 (+) Transcript_10606:134-538(+)|eukprot:CAMPEP_0171499364 /NCGR_PEP_ID=MMETSP0958-20121227/8392_1 /TAXON_ID=87120 /ORGANISM="Aurantiochytrium limacinum, Strain ATCCMYA-1381" /LENGTH=134 /DNA_ID=CAMNT_0012033921 /DNA_START=102 /DNA_END=506 /DNA_ORIENTATION=+